MLNIHPLVVHFPIALLTFYAVLECLRFKRLTSRPWFFPLKAVLVIAGTLGALAGLQSGDLIEDSFEDLFGPLMELHASFATASTIIFGIIALAYLIVWLTQETAFSFRKDSLLQKIWSLKGAAAGFLLKAPIAIILALAGLVCLTITGALGGAMVHGPSVDPLVAWIHSLFF